MNNIFQNRNSSYNDQASVVFDEEIEHVESPDEKQDRMFINLISNNLMPEDVFSVKQLEDWAERNDFMEHPVRYLIR